jgi:hypothetical protein
MKKTKLTGVSETRKWHGKTYYLFDFCATEEETRQELRNLRKTGYLAHHRPCQGGFHIFACPKE